MFQLPRIDGPTRVLTMRITEAERAHIKSIAAAAGMTVSDYMRGLVPGLAESNNAAADAVGKEPASAT